jgi:long-chain acyl-CoA synthetase
MSWTESEEYVSDFARGIKALNLMPDVEAEGKLWNFLGIYAKNRPEWALADLASASIGGTTIAFYDTLGPQAIEFVIS